MPQTPNRSNNELNNLGPTFDTAGRKATSHSERLHLLDLKYHIGEIIEFQRDKNTPPEQAIKIADGQYIDIKTRKPLNLMDAGRFLLKGRRVSFAEASNRVGEFSKNMMRYKEHLLTIDFETAITRGKKNLDPAEVFNVGLAGIFGKGENRKLLATEFYLTDVFDMFTQDDPHSQSKASTIIESMSDPVKRGYIREFRKLARTRNLPGLKNLIQPKDLTDVQNRGVIKRLVTEIQEMKNQTFQYADPAKQNQLISERFLGTTKANVVRGLSFSNRVKSQMEGFMNIRFNDENVALGAVSPDLVDQRAMQAIGVGDDYNMVDIRGHQLFVNATVFPELTRDLTPTFGPMMDRIANRLRLSDKERKKIFQLMGEGGISSIYGKGTAAEDFYSALEFSVGNSGKLTFKGSQHTAMADTLDAMKVMYKSDTFVDKAIKESVYPGIQYVSPRSRRLTAFMLNQVAGAMQEDSHIFSKTPADKKRIMDFITRKVDPIKMSREIQDMVENTTSLRIERNILHSNLKQFGGTTVKHLLGGSLLLAGVRTAVNKAKARFLDSKENNTEGLRHDSIPTIISRVALTDFGSTRVGSNPTSAVFGVLGTVFRNIVNNKKGSYRIVHDTLKSIGSSLSNAKRSGTYLGMLRSRSKTRQLMQEVFGPNGHIITMAGTLHRHGHIDEGTVKTVAKATSAIKNTVGSVIKSSELAKFGAAGRIARTNMVQRISNAFVTRGKDGNPQLLLKAPAVMMGAGMLGALTVMLSRGRYNPEEAMQPLPTAKELKYSRAENDKKNVRRMIADVRNTQLEGMIMGSRDRQKLRYSLTDFGSGWRGILNTATRLTHLVSPTSEISGQMLRRFAITKMGYKVPTRAGAKAIAKIRGQSAKTISRTIDDWMVNVNGRALEGTDRIRALRHIVEEARNVDQGMTNTFNLKSGYFKSVKEIAMDLIENGAPVVKAADKHGTEKVVDAIMLQLGTTTKRVPIRLSKVKKYWKDTTTGRLKKSWMQKPIISNNTLQREFSTLGEKVPIYKGIDFSDIPELRPGDLGSHYRDMQAIVKTSGGRPGRAWTNADKYRAFMLERLNPGATDQLYGNVLPMKDQVLAQIRAATRTNNRIYHESQRLAPSAAKKRHVNSAAKQLRGVGDEGAKFKQDTMRVHDTVDPYVTEATMSKHSVDGLSAAHTETARTGKIPGSPVEDLTFGRYNNKFKSIKIDHKRIFEEDIKDRAANISRSKTSTINPTDVIENINVKELERLHANKIQGAPVKISTVKTEQIRSIPVSIKPQLTDYAAPDKSLSTISVNREPRMIPASGLRKTPNDYIKRMNDRNVMNRDLTNIKSQNTAQERTVLKAYHSRPRYAREYALKSTRDELQMSADFGAQYVLKYGKRMGFDKVPHGSQGIVGAPWLNINRLWIDDAPLNMV